MVIVLRTDYCEVALLEGSATPPKRTYILVPPDLLSSASGRALWRHQESYHTMLDIGGPLPPLLFPFITSDEMALGNLLAVASRNLEAYLIPLLNRMKLNYRPDFLYLMTAIHLHLEKEYRPVQSFRSVVRSWGLSCSLFLYALGIDSLKDLIALERL
jgi:hypothetical protein